MVGHASKQTHLYASTYSTWLRVAGGALLLRLWSGFYGVPEFMSGTLLYHYSRPLLHFCIIGL